jgi:hypothetical protein
VALLAVAAAALPVPAYASNCSSLNDCWDSIAAAVLVAVALAALLAIGIAVLPALAVEAVELAEVAEVAAEAEAGAAEADLAGVLAKDAGELASELSHEAYGSAAVNNAAEYEAIMGDLESSGVDVNLNADVGLGQGAYGPASAPGAPGTLTVNPEVDISTLGHEYEHFLMDRELGFPGMRGYMENPQLFVDGEIRAYNTEIARAAAGGNTALADALEAAKQGVVDAIRSRYGL